MPENNIEKNNSKKTVWITGGSRGIGLATARAMSEEGYQVVISGTSPAAEYIAQELFNYDWLDYQNVHYYPCNIADPDSIEFVRTNIRKQVGHVDILINNAGVFDMKSTAQHSDADVRNMFDVNFFGAVNLSASLSQEMAQRGGGMIVNILSVAAKRAFAGAGAYSASKAALAAYGDCLRAEMRDKGVQVLNIYPGATKTDIWPGETAETQGHRMIDPNGLGNAIAKAVISCQQGNLAIEEMTIRPIGGDL
jgi:short-subunit dehydrogenase